MEEEYKKKKLLFLEPVNGRSTEELAETIIRHPQTLVLIAVPLLIQTYGIFIIAYIAARTLKLSHNIAAPACLIGTSNFFELAVAVAISLFGLNSGAALATVVGVLVEVPVMLSLVYFINHTKHFFSVENDQLLGDDINHVNMD